LWDRVPCVETLRRCTVRSRAAAALLAAVAVSAPCVGGLCAPPAAAEEGEPSGTKFHFGTHPARTTVLFQSETSVETIYGTARSMSGTAVLDFEKGEGVADLHIAVKDLDTGIPARNEHLQGKDWMEAAKHPEIVFASKSLKRIKSDDATKKETWSYEGDLTIHGVTKPWKGEASVQRIPPEIGKKLGAGEWVKVKTEFQVALKDFDIKVPDIAAAKVSPIWEVKVDIFGTTVLPERK